MTVGDIVASTDIGAYIGQYVDLNPEGKELFGLCPFHHEDTPSFSVTPDKNQWYCFGCHKGGNILTFIAQYHKVKSAEAVKILCDYAGVSKDSLSGAQLNAILRSMRPKPFSTKKSTYIPLRDDVMEQYENNYEKLKVWIDEGIHPTVLENHQVRYDPADDRIVYPIVDMDGQIVAVCGRTLNRVLKCSPSSPALENTGLNGLHKCVFCSFLVAYCSDLSHLLYSASPVYTNTYV